MGRNAHHYDLSLCLRALFKNLLKSVYDSGVALFRSCLKSAVFKRFLKSVESNGEESCNQRDWNSTVLLGCFAGIIYLLYLLDLCAIAWTYVSRLGLLFLDLDLCVVA